MGGKYRLGSRPARDATSRVAFAGIEDAATPSKRARRPNRRPSTSFDSSLISVSVGATLRSRVSWLAASSWGEHTHINAGCIVIRAKIGAFCNLSPRVTVCGDVTIGDFVTIGAGATISNLVTIGNAATIGAGATAR